MAKRIRDYPSQMIQSFHRRVPLLTPKRFVVFFVAAVLAIPDLPAGDVIELTNGNRLRGKVLKRTSEAVTFEAAAGSGGMVVTIPLARIRNVTIEKEPPVPAKTPTPAPTATPIPTPAPASTPSRRPVIAPPPATRMGNTRSRAEVMAIIEKAGRTPPEWWDSVQPNYPKTLDLTWKKTKNWDNQRTLGQFIWDIINPNPHRWREGIKLLHHCLTVNRNDEEALVQTIEALAGMYKRLLGDYARAAFWWQKAADMTGWYNDPLALAECYWKLGSKDLAVKMIDQYRYDPTGHGGLIKLWSDMGEFDRALQLAERKARSGMPQVGYLAAGDVCRLAGRYEQALAYYQKAASTPIQRGENKDYYRRNRDRALASIEAIKVFDALDLSRIPDGTYRSSSIGYRGPVHVEVVIQNGRIEDVRVTRHQEKQYYSSITDTTRQIVEKQGVKGVDATSRATITAEAIINATAKALAGGMK